MNQSLRRVGLFHLAVVGVPRCPPRNGCRWPLRLMAWGTTPCTATAFAIKKGSGLMGAADLKTIVYRGGVVRFRIPADWQEEYEPEGGGIFYAPGDETGTLRLNVTTFRSPAGKVLQLTDAEGFLTQVASKHAAQVQSLRPGVAIVRYDLPAKDRGHGLVIRYWQVAQMLLPGHVRQSLFSYTVPAKLFDDWLLRHEMDLLEREIHIAEFAPSVGEVPRPS